MAKATRKSGVGGWWPLVMALLAPLTVFVAVAGVNLGALDSTMALDTVTLTAARALAWLGLAAGVLGLILALTRRGSAWPSLAALVIAGVGLGLFFRYDSLPHGLPSDVSTNPEDPPGFSSALADFHGATRSATCPGIEAYAAQSAPEGAAYALDKAGFTVPSAGVGRAEGTRTGVWFGFTEDAVIRIRPGRTDVRVAARDVGHDRGEACRRLALIVDALNPSATTR